MIRIINNLIINLKGFLVIYLLDEKKNNTKFDRKLLREKMYVLEKNDSAQKT